MIESWFIEEAVSQEGWGMDFSSVTNGETSEEKWTRRVCFNARGIQLARVAMNT
jgi:hypothetical protein